jgi:predicted Zn-dependent protease
MPVSALDRVLADYNVRELESDFPFRETRRVFRLPEPRNRVERLAQRYRRGEISWLEAMETLLQSYRAEGRLAEAAVVARIVARADPAAPMPNYVTGALLMQLGRPERGRRYLERSLAAAPDDPKTLSALVQVHFALDEPVEANRMLERLEALAPSHPTVQRFRRPGPRTEP